MYQAHGLSHHGGQTGLVSSTAICKACTEYCTPYDAGTCAGYPYAVCRMPYGISPWPVVEVSVLRFSPSSVLLRVCSTHARDFSRGCASIEKN